MRKIFIGIILCTCTFAVVAQNWAEIQKKTLRFYRYQRAGQKGVHCHNPYYEDITSNWPHQNDNYNGKDLSGGWYDAGDFVKFGLPFSSTVYILLKGYDVFPGGYSDNDSWDKFDTKDNIPDVLNEVKFATDFILKAVINNSTVVYDIGDGSADHACSLNGCGGPTNSSSVGNRPVRMADGADVPGLYAASLALMSQLYRKYDSKYADSCLMKSKEAYQAGWSKRSKGVSSQYGEFYNSSKTPSGFIWHDKLMAGAIELYRVTKEQKYIDDLKVLGQNDAIMHNNIGYTNVAPIVSFEMWRQGVGTIDALRSHISFLKEKVLSSPANMNGAYFNQHWGMAGATACAAFAAALAYVADPTDAYKSFAETQLMWVSGHKSGTRSWIVGYNSGPSQVHHRNAIWKGKPPEGGIVSGPDDKGNYQDNAGAYEYTEVALDYNAGIPGAVAFMRDLTSDVSVKITKELTASTISVKFSTTSSVSFTATLDKAVKWTLVLTGQASGAKRVFTGNSSSINVTWTGDADEGSFVASDIVNAQLEIENLAAYHISRSKTSLEVKDVKLLPFKSTDVLVDDFDDGDYKNKQGGQWSVFDDKSAGGNSSTYPTSLPAKNENTGETKLGHKVILYTGAGLAHPFSGTRTTFNTKGTLVSLGGAKSIAFDVKGTTASIGSSFYVEIEQEDITDSAYYGAKVTIGNDLWNRIRIPLTETALSVRSWKTASKPLSLAKVRAIRFVNYESESVNITLDSVHIEDLKIIDPASVRDFYLSGKSRIMHCQNTISIPGDIFEGTSAKLEILNMRGVRVHCIPVDMKHTGKASVVNVDLRTFADGLYVMRISNDKKSTVTVPISVVGR